jgi:hypothetical protein
LGHIPSFLLSLSLIISVIFGLLSRSWTQWW